MAGDIFDNSSLPYSLEAEQAVLGSLLINPECLLKVVEIINKSECFYIPQHREIYKTIINLDALGQKFDALLVLEQLKNSDVYDDAGGRNYLAQLAQSVPSTANVLAYARIVKENYILRTLIEAARDMEQKATAAVADADSILDDAERKIYNIRQGRESDGPAKLSDIISSEVLPDLQNKTSADREKYLGIPSGFSYLDMLTTGFNKSDLVLIGARPAMGKTSFALNLARNMAVTGKKKVVFFSLEMSKEQLAQRVLSTEARVESSKFRTGKIEGDEWTRIGEAAYQLSQAELYFDDTTMITVPTMKARIRRLKNVDAVVIDYLQLMTGSKRYEGNRVQEVSEITRNLKLMAKDLHIPVIVCSQLNRSTDARGKMHRPQLSDLRESGSIEQDADIVMMLYRPNYYENDGKNDTNVQVEVSNDNEAQVLVVKNRHGSTGDVDLVWTKEFTMFSTREKLRDGDA